MRERVLVILQRGKPDACGGAPPDSFENALVDWSEPVAEVDARHPNDAEYDHDKAEGDRGLTRRACRAFWNTR